MIFPLNLLIKLFDKIFINPARHTNSILFFFKILSSLFSSIDFLFKVKIFLSILNFLAKFKPFAFRIVEITRLII